MTPAGDLTQRLQAFIKTTVYTLVQAPAKVTVIEREKSGEADVECTIPEGSLCIEWSLPTGLFEFLQKNKNADGAFIVQRPGGQLEAHIVECKKTITQAKWAEATQQMCWTLAKLRALSGVLGVTLSRVMLYTAFQTDKLSSDEALNPAVVKHTLGPRPGRLEDNLELDCATRQSLAWENGEVRLRGFEGSFLHKKIELDQYGRGAVVFDCS